MSTDLALSDPNLALVISAIETDPDLQESTKHQYSKAVRNYVEAGHALTDADALAGYALEVGSSTRSFLSAAVTKLAKRIALEAKSRATPDNVAAVQATVYRAEALQKAITTERPKGRRAHTWLNQAQVKSLLDTCGDGITGQRDRLVIGLLTAAGLRRQEAADLRFEDVKLLPIRGKMRTVLSVRGKGAKDRVVPISDRLANALDAWAAVVGGSGRVVRSLGRARELGEGMSTTAIYDLVRKRGAMIGKPDLQPHDLRRSFAQLGYEAGVPITQISTLLGHADLSTTQRYLNLEIDLESTISDFIPF